MNIKKFFAKLLLILNVLQVIAPATSVQAAPTAKKTSTPNNLHLPSRRAFIELTEGWEGLEPAAYVKDTTDTATEKTGSQIAKFVGAQRASLRDSSKSRPLFESLSFLNNLATPGDAIANMNCTKRLLSDMQFFGDKGLHKSINRTILALGQTLQLAQLYEGASSARVAEERRDFITETLKQPEVARALSIRIKCFGQYENQFLRQTKTPRNKFLEKEINALAPSRTAKALSRVVGYSRNSTNFLKQHARFTQKLANVPFVGYDSVRSAYIFSTTWIALHLLLRGLLGWPNKWAKGESQEATAEATTLQRQEEITQEEAESRELKSALQNTTLTIGKEVVKAELQVPSILIQVLSNLYKIISTSLFKQGFNSLRAKKAEDFRPPVGLAKAFTKKGAQQVASNGIFAARNNASTKLACDIAAGPFISLASIPDVIHTLWAAYQGKKNTTDGDEFTSIKNALAEHKGTLRIPSTRLDGYAALGRAPENFRTFCQDAIKNNPDVLKGYLHEKANGRDQSLTSLAAELWKHLDIFGWQATGELIDDTQRAMRQPAARAGMETINSFKFRRLAWLASTFSPSGFITSIYSQLPRYFAPGFWQTWNLATTPAGSAFRALTGSYSNQMRGMLRNIKALIAASKLASGLSKKVPVLDTLSTSRSLFKELGSLKRKSTKLVADISTHVMIPDPTAPSDPNRKIGVYIQPEAIPVIDALHQIGCGKIPRDTPFISLRRLTLTPPPAGSAPNTPSTFKPEQAEDGSPCYLTREEAFEVLRQHAARTDIIEGTVTTSEEQQKTQKNYKALSVATLGGGLALEALLMGFFLFTGYSWALGVLKTNDRVFTIDILDQHMFDSLKPTVALAEMTRQMGEILLAHKSTIPLPTSLQEKLNFLMTSASPECKEFSKLARDPMFLKKNKPGRFGNFGIIRRAYQLAGTQTVKEWLDTSAVFMAEVDSYLAIARLTAENKDHPNFFSPVTFIEQDTPHIALKGFWLPIISTFISIANNITIGKPAHILLTGINGGGKSIALKGMVFSILMAHAWGYAPLAEGEMTFMSKIITHLSSTDNAAEGDSCWIAEAKSMGKALHEMHAPRRPGELILYIGDELGSGTADHAAIASVAQFMEIALTTPHVASIISTHLRPLTQLEELSGGLVLNYRVGGTVDEEGTIQRKYRLERGVADINIAELIVNQLIEHGHQKTAVHPDSKPAPILA